MKRFKITCVIGTRPEALKMLPVIWALQHNDLFKVRTLITGQHRELVMQFLENANIAIDANFDVMEPNQSLNILSANLLRHFEQELTHNACDLLIAQGDTSTTWVAALSAFYKKIPFAHVEAGLRTPTIDSPFPEEFNRRVASLIATLHFCPTQQAADNLVKEGITQRIFVTGNTIIDTLLHYADEVKIERSKKKLLLVTCHRRENFGKPLLSICQALTALAKRNPEIDIVFPVHPNPQVKTVVEEQLSSIQNIELCPPLEYTQLVRVMKSSFLILTDSGGLQEEAPALNKPVLVLRNETERPEGIACGAALLVGHDTNHIVNQVEKLLHDEASYQRMSQAGSPYGDGRAAARIVAAIEEFLTN